MGFLKVPLPFQLHQKEMIDFPILEAALKQKWILSRILLNGKIEMYFQKYGRYAFR